MKRPLAPLAGPAVLWIAHFVAVYGLASLSCSATAALSSDWAVSPSAAIFWGAGVLTVAGLGLAMTAIARHGSKLGQRDVSEQDTFVHRTCLLLYGLSAVGMLWVALPAIAMPGCA